MVFRSQDFGARCVHCCWDSAATSPFNSAGVCVCVYVCLSLCMCVYGWVCVFVLFCVSSYYFFLFQPSSMGSCLLSLFHICISLFLRWKLWLPTSVDLLICLVLLCAQNSFRSTTPITMINSKPTRYNFVFFFLFAALFVFRLIVYVECTRSKSYLD